MKINPIAERQAIAKAIEIGKLASELVDNPVQLAKIIEAVVLGSKQARHFPIYGITPAALRALIEHNFDGSKRNGAGLERAHMYERRQRTIDVLAMDDIDAAVDHWLKCERTVVATAAENRTNSHDSFIPIDPNVFGMRMAGFSVNYRKHKAFLLDLAANHIEAA
jgi:hypothetical protein